MAMKKVEKGTKIGSGDQRQNTCLLLKTINFIARVFPSLNIRLRDKVVDENKIEI